MQIDGTPDLILDGKLFSAQHSGVVGGEQISCRIDAQEFLFLDENGETEASFFAFSQLRTDREEKNRPVLFCFGGGPLCSSSEFFIGAFGPVVPELKERMTAPFRTRANEDWILRVCDVVCIDPPGSGYARLYKDEARKKYWGIEQDAGAFARLIEHWLSKYGRWNSPKYLCGESYGGARAAILTGELLGGAMHSCGRAVAITVNGVILLSDCNNYDLAHDENHLPGIPAAVSLVPACAAANYYHAPEGKGNLEQWLRDAYAFSFGPYADYLRNRAETGDEMRKTIADRLSRFVGIPAEELSERDLEFDCWYYADAYLKKEGKALGVYDAEYTIDGGSYGTELYDVTSDDASLNYFWPMLQAVMNDYCYRELGIDWDRQYILQNFKAGYEWDYSLKGTANDRLALAMRRNPQLKVLICRGIYDLRTPFSDGRWTLEHCGLPADRVVYREYEAGHMIYLCEKTRGLFSADLQSFLQRTAENEKN